MATNPNPELRHVDDVVVPRKLFPKVPMDRVTRTHTTWTVDKDDVTKTRRETVPLNRVQRRLIQTELTRQLKRIIKNPRRGYGPF